MKQVGETGGFLNALESGEGLLAAPVGLSCFPGFVLQEEFGECIPCRDFYGCKHCSEFGCITCDDGSKPFLDLCKSRSP